MLIIETGKGTKVEVPVPSATGVTEVKLEGNVLYVDGKEAGKVEIPEGETVKVEVKEDGKLYINDEVQDLEIGSKVVMVDNGNGTYTMTVDGKSYILPKASASVLALQVTSLDAYNGDGILYFSENYLTGKSYSTNAGTIKKGVNWGLAAADLADWTGPKGAIKKGQLLVGAINTLEVTVTPLKTDLSQAKLTLVDMNGKEAPATIVATPKTKEDITTGSRAASNDGTWTLSITPTASAENMGSAYTSASPSGKVCNTAYALAVDDVVMTGYNIAVDTWTNSEVDTNEEVEPAFATSGSTKLYFGDDEVTYNTGAYSIAKVALGKTKITYKDASVYDVQIDIAEESKEDAELLEVTLDKATNTLNVGDKAAANKEGKIKLNVTLLGVNGEKSETIQVTLAEFETTSVDDKVTLATTPYTVVTTGSKDVIINLEETFSSLTADQSTKLDNGAKWAIGTANNFLVSGTEINDIYYINDTNIKYYATEADAKDEENEIELNDQTTGSRVRNIKYARITIGSYNTAALTGKRNLTLTLSTPQGEIKKVTVPVEVTLPKFEDLFSKTTKWTDGELNLRLIATAQNATAVNFNAGFEATNDGVTVNTISYGITPVNNKDIFSSQSSGVVRLNKDNITTNNVLTVKEFTVNASYTIASVTKFVVKTSFTTNIKSMFEGAELVYYKDNAIVDVAEVNGQKISAFTGNGSDDSKYNGLAVKFGKVFKAMADDAKVDGVSIVDKVDGDQKVSVNLNVTGLNNVNATRGDNGDVTFSNTTLQTGDSGVLTATFTDWSGIKTTASIKFQK